MKEEAQQPWEAEVRRVVETHEFEYDPAAWAGMEELLDATPPAAGGNAGSWWTGGWKWLLPSIVAVGVASWLAWPTAVEPPSLEGTFPISLETKTQPPQEESAAPSTTISLPQRVRALPSLPSRPLPPLVVPQPELPEPIVVIPPAVSAIPVLEPAPLLPPKKSDDLLKPTIKRQRNRKTLFPDVIKNY